MEGEGDMNNMSINGSPDRLGDDNAGLNYSQEMDAKAKSLAEVKRRRKEIERDAQLLANRIALLKQEEMKTWKKIEETKKRTGEIQNLKKRNEEKVQKKVVDLQLNMENQKMNQQNNFMIQKQRQDEKRKIQEAIYLSKLEEVKQTKMIKQQNDQKKRHINMKVEQENKMKNQMILQQKRLAQLKIEDDKRRRVHSVKRDVEKRVDDEGRVKQMKEQEVMQMEMLEMELIKKLQNTQAIQKEAYAELEKALSQPNKMIGSYLLKNVIPSTKARGGGQGESSPNQNNSQIM